MKWIRDLTGRFAQRPHYELEELDAECEGLVATFLRSKYGEVSYPITTNDLVILVEQEAGTLDLYADVSAEGEGIEGVTDFYCDRKPEVRVAAALSEQSWRENRLRTTLTHELGHVRFHTFLWALGQSIPMPLFGSSAESRPARCKRDTMLGIGTTDWMEWQAGYACGAFLMPRSLLRQFVHELQRETGLRGIISSMSPVGGTLIQRVQQRFQVSADAARIRLLKLDILTDAAPSLPLIAVDGL